MDQADEQLLSLLATDLDYHFRQLVALYQQRLYGFALRLGDFSSCLSRTEELSCTQSTCTAAPAVALYDHPEYFPQPPAQA